MNHDPKSQVVSRWILWPPGSWPSAGRHLLQRAAGAAAGRGRVAARGGAAAAAAPEGAGRQHRDQQQRHERLRDKPLGR